MLYDISDVCRIFQLSPNGIRYYEELGLIHPARSTGGRRRYAEEEMRMMLHVKSCRAMGIDVREIAETFTNRTHSTTDDMLSVLDEKIFDLRAEIENLNRALRPLQRYRGKMEQFSGTAAPMLLPTEPPPICFLSLPTLFGRTAKEQEQVAEWIALVPAVRKMDLYEVDEMTVSHRTGLAVHRDFAERKQLPLLDRAQTLSFNETYKTYCDVPHMGERGLPRKELDAFLREARKLAGWDRVRVVTSFLFGNVRQEVRHKYIEVWISEGTQPAAG